MQSGVVKRRHHGRNGFCLQLSAGGKPSLVLVFFELVSFATSISWALGFVLLLLLVQMQMFNGCL